MNDWPPKGQLIGRVKAAAPEAALVQYAFRQLTSANAVCPIARCGCQAYCETLVVRDFAQTCLHTNDSIAFIYPRPVDQIVWVNATAG